MSRKLICNLPQNPSSYEILLQKGILQSPKELSLLLSRHGTRFAIITDNIVANFYGESLQKLLKEAEIDAYLFTFPYGEASKTRDTKERIEDQMFSKKLGRDTCILALGGGVVTDLAGYIAATYCRGVPFVMIPTTLLGMVDASLGGKTGVNVPFGKNLLGCIYQPEMVLIDIETLKSMSPKEVRNGIVEMIKHGLVADESHFNYLRDHSQELLELNSEMLEEAIYQSCHIKNEIVKADEKESGKRRVVNLGHTVGHAIELLLDFSIPHGEAVAIGILVETHLAVQMDYLNESILSAIIDIFKRYQIRCKLPIHLTPQAIQEAMILDKKSEKGIPRFVMLNQIGSTMDFEGAYCTAIDSNMQNKALQWMSQLDMT